MRYPIPISILAYSMSFAIAAGASQPEPGASEDADVPGKESTLPAKEKAPGLKKTEKAKTEKVPAPQANPEEKEEEEVPDSPAEAEDVTDCDECVIVQADPIPSAPQADAIAPVTAAGMVSSGVRTQAEGWPMAMARTLWGLFFVGRPRLFPKTHIRGATVR